MNQCPVMQQQDGKLKPSTTARCPVSQNSDDVNPVNQVPFFLSQSPASNQSIALSTKREQSSIPCETSSEPDPAESSSTWMYPSPQQFFNALTRKGYEMPQDQMETMVQLHNFLNEEAWADVLRWEERWHQSTCAAPTLVQIRGKPKELSFKARGLLVAGWLLPSRFDSTRPFDRHDWLVRRASGKEIRYIIDYYRAPPDESGNPAFALDVRPASDSVDNIKQRVSVVAGALWTSLFSETRH